MTMSSTAVGFAKIGRETVRRIANGRQNGSITPREKRLVPVHIAGYKQIYITDIWSESPMVTNKRHMCRLLHQH